jgi:transposase
VIGFDANRYCFKVLKTPKAMPQPLRMHQVRRIFEFHQQGRSIRQMEQLSGVSRNTIREYLRRIPLSGLSIEELLKLDDEHLMAIVQTDAIGKNRAGRLVDDRHQIIEQRLGHFKAELSRRGVTRQLLWQEYRSDHPEGYGYTQFCEHLSRHLKRDQAVMHFVHQPGEQLQVDFAGGKLGYVDRSTGEWIACEVLVCAMPFSHYAYVEALRSQQQQEFIKGLAHALHYLGGVPHSIKCDNMKTAVVRSNRYEPSFTEAMEWMAAHYGTTIVTARVRKPRDKSSVEKAVDLTYKNIYAPLRDQVFHSLEELNAAIGRQLEVFNAQPFKVKTGSRKQLFEQQEKSELKELPCSPYLVKNITHGKVQRNYHIILGEDRHQYSVPYTLIGKKLRVIYTTDTVEVYDQLHRVVVHKRSYKKNRYTTLAEHMPPNHRHMAEQRGWDDEYFLREASYRGQAVHEVIKRILTSKAFYEQTYNSCLGILRLGKQYGNQRLEAACQRALPAPTVNYGLIADILKKHLDKTSPVQERATPSHGQIRGPQTYQ